MTLADIPKPDRPIKLAIIGAGNRSRTIYTPLWSSLKNWFEIVAVCDPVEENGQAMAREHGVPYYGDIRELVKDKPMEAALIITPPDSHHSISVFLSENGIHNHCETPLAQCMRQSRDMLDQAKKNNVILSVAENFFRYPIDRFSQQVKNEGCIGDIKRIFSYGDHTGYHNNSRWIHFAGTHPTSVQAIEHDMPTMSFNSTKERHHERECFTSRYFYFPNEFLVMDQMANAKGFLGRHIRPGYTEWQGTHGTLTHHTADPLWHNFSYRYHDAEGETHEKTVPNDWRNLRSEIRLCEEGNAWATDVCQIKMEYESETWTRIYANTPDKLIEHVNPYRSINRSEHLFHEYGASIMDHLIDFCLNLRGLKDSEFSAEDAVMSSMMESAVAESALNDGKRIALPLKGDLESDDIFLRKQRDKHGVDPMDIEAMLSISYPKP